MQTARKQLLQVKQHIEGEIHFTLMKGDLTLLQKVINSVIDKQKELGIPNSGFTFDGKFFSDDRTSNLHSLAVAGSNTATNPISYSLHFSLVKEFSPHYLLYKSALSKVNFIVRVIMKAVYLSYDHTHGKFAAYGIPHNVAKIISQEEHSWYFIPLDAEQNFVCSKTDRDNLERIKPDVDYFLSLHCLI